MPANPLQYISSSQAVTIKLNREPYFLEHAYYEALQLGNHSLANLSIYERRPLVAPESKAQKAAALITSWLNEASDYDQDVYPELEKALKSGTMRCREE